MNGPAEPPDHVLLGYDASQSSERALGWAVREAELRGLALVVCHAWYWPYPFRRHDDRALEGVRAMGAAIVEEGIAMAREVAAELDVRGRLVRGTAPAALLTAAGTAELVVLGARGTGGFDGLRAGSTAIHVPAHTDRPVVVVPPASFPPRDDGIGIVAGVDGSPASEAALEFAFTEARARGLAVTAVCGWWGPDARPGPGRAPFTDPDTAGDRVRTRFENTVARHRAAHPAVPAETRFVTRRPHQALADIARGATLLAVGDRGCGSSPQTLLGAVTRTMLHEAPCPVAIVHERPAEGDRT
ncbi:universal stress protein [Actinomadura viridis]|uniref:Nucleotide-binding universal stress UspA family protein n=1 Tax=Actinomadura viridis TaxID=58110 RepID=A0A931GJH6_9ACTN|nr:universal stress protein [Actinomadura viridis]MBG6089192.1 nucleotide-binding universal stress UspA family protein [Actinomadura viridis]